jgi:peroxiredoxin Q/BCP
VSAVGINPDPVEKQKKSSQKQRSGFPLLSDGDHAVAKAYGVWGEKTMFGKKVRGILRSSFLIDEKAKIIQAWYKISPQDTVLNALQARGGKGNPT